MLLEAFTTLARDKGHWEFELFLTLLTEGAVGYLLWPWVKRHIHRDVAEEHEHERAIVARVAALEEYVGYVAEGPWDVSRPQFSATSDSDDHSVIPLEYLPVSRADTRPCSLCGYADHTAAGHVDYMAARGSRQMTHYVGDRCKGGHQHD